MNYLEEDNLLLKFKGFEDEFVIDLLLNFVFGEHTL